jgi:hypothetical protein
MLLISKRLLYGNFLLFLSISPVFHAELSGAMHDMGFCVFGIAEFDGK